MVETASFSKSGVTFGSDQIKNKPAIMTEMLGEATLFFFAAQIGTDGVVQAQARGDLVVGRGGLGR